MRGLLQQIRAKLFLGPLIWLAYRVKFIVYKRSLKLQQLLLNKLKYQLRVFDPNSRSEGFDKQFDKLVQIAALKMSRPEIFDFESHKFLFQGFPDTLIQKYSEINEEYEKIKNDVDPFIDSTLKNHRIRRTIEMYALVNNFSSAQRKDEKESEYYLSLAKKYNPEASPIDIKRFFELDEETRKQIRTLKEEISDREAIKIALSLKDIGALVSIVSAFFLITGYLYNNFLLGHFEIEVSRYFSLSDYLASSIEGVRYSASATIIGLVFYFAGMHSASRKSYAQTEIERKRKDYAPYFIIVVTVALTIKYYLEDSEFFYSLAYASIFFIALFTAPWISRRYFKEPMIALTSIVFIFSFSAHMFESVGREIYRLEHKSIEELKRYTISFKGNVPFNTANVALIAANSSYLFLLDGVKNVFIVPKDQIDYVTLDKKQPSKSH
jgi:hypothetical protein